jgi:hypothetical protein
MEREIWKGGVITQPFLKKENDNNLRRASHRKQPIGACGRGQSVSLEQYCGPGSRAGLLRVMCACEREGGWKLEPVLSAQCLLSKRAASQRNGKRARVPHKSILWNSVG